MQVTIQEGDDVLLFLDRRRDFLVKVEKEKLFHTHKGFIQLENLIGEPYGTRIKSSLDVDFVALKPTLRDYIFKISRSTQIIYPKDIAMIVMFGNILPGSYIVEAGTGSGALAIALAYHVMPSGRVFSYEMREEFITSASKNFERAGVTNYIRLKNRDITEGIEERELDAIILDMSTPWLVVPYASDALKGSSIFVSFSPTIDQVVKTTESLKENGFVALKTIECLLRGIKTDIGKTRPETLMTGHTGYITFARKALPRK